MENPGRLILSLDLELFWGVFDTKTVAAYGENILGVRQVIPGLLALFRKYGVKATFATVGFLFCKDRGELLAAWPDIRPSYQRSGLSAYEHPFEDDAYHFCAPLVRLILDERVHEIASHTFSHYYCLEPGQTHEQFLADLRAASECAGRLGLVLSSLVFPRNQVNPEYLGLCRQAGILTYRGNQRSWVYRTHNRTLLGRTLRWMDSYLNLSGSNAFTLVPAVSEPMNIPASAFLRPYSKRFPFLNRLHLKRLTQSLLQAARQGKNFHLWWHPHNFGRNVQDNLEFLDRVLQCFRVAQRCYGMRSCTMGEIGASLV